MRKLSECKKGCIVQIVKIHAKDELKQRLISFGIMRNEKVEVLELAPTKGSIEIIIGKTRVALRAQEAELIEVIEL